MDIQKCEKPAFSVIGKEGSTKDGAGFVQKLWADANAHFSEVASLAKKDAGGKPAGIWGAMTDFSRSFLPWENDFSEGLYLAGVECADDAQAPVGWSRWRIPGYVYWYVENTGNDVFARMAAHLKEHRIPLVGAVQEFCCPETGKGYLFFPIGKLQP